MRRFEAPRRHALIAANAVAVAFLVATSASHSNAAAVLIPRPTIPNKIVGFRGRPTNTETMVPHGFAFVSSDVEPFVGVSHSNVTVSADQITRVKLNKSIRNTAINDTGDPEPLHFARSGSILYPNTANTRDPT